ncbi:2375_t:CDS:2, partial [Acaulospora morrowiae]
SEYDTPPFIAFNPQACRRHTFKACSNNNYDIVRRNYFEERGSGRGFAGNRREDNFRGRSGNIRPGDWQCKSCGVNNFAYRTECFECGEKVRDREVAPGDWICPKCDFYNFQSRLACFKCHTPAPTFESTEPVEKT